MITADDFKRRRLALGYETQKKCAEAFGVSLATIRAWEQGQRKVLPWAAKFLACLEERKILTSKVTGYESSF